jgi:hypothetical protein
MNRFNTHPAHEPCWLEGWSWNVLVSGLVVVQSTKAEDSIFLPMLFVDIDTYFIVHNKLNIAIALFISCSIIALKFIYTRFKYIKPKMHD